MGVKPGTQSALEPMPSIGPRDAQMLSNLKVTGANAAKLRAFRDKICGNPRAQVHEPEFMMFLASVLDVSVPKLRKNPETTRALLRALAMNISQAPKYKTLAADMSYGDEQRQPDEQTVKHYLQMLKDLYLLTDLEGWEPPMRAKSRVRTKPKRYFIDPSLPAAVLGASPSALLRDTQTLGNLFETLCIRDLSVYLSAMPGAGNRIAYYRDDKGLEVDVIVELSDGRWGAIEIKLSDLKATDENAAKLKAFRHKICGNPKGQVREPEFMMFLTGRGGRAYCREDGILVVPIATLGA